MDTNEPNQSDAFPPLELNRRKFLTLCVLGTLPGLLAACQTEPSKVSNMMLVPTRQPSSTRQPSPSPTRQPTPTRQPSPTGSDWSKLARSLRGTLVRPDNPQYPLALQLFNPRFDSVRPAAIAYCVSPADVQTCLAFAHHFDLPLAPRAGGHSYAGYSTSTGLVLDVTRMSGVSVDLGSGTAMVGAGTRLIDVYAALAQYGLALPAGTCPTVGIAGLTLGGGVGVLGRKFGLTCDNLLAAQVILANGRVLTCDASHDPDLFWALRGGGGGNFAVVTSFTFQAHQVGILSFFTLNWPWGSAAEVVYAWQHWAPQAPDELWSSCWLQATSNKESDPVVQVDGVYLGGVASLASLLQQLTGLIGAAPASSYVSGAGLLEAMLYEANCDGKSVNECHLPSQNLQGQLQRATFRAKSDYFTGTLPHQAIDALVSAVERCQFSSTLGAGGIGLDAFGGAINRVPADATAFVHRDALFSAQYSMNWDSNDPNSVVAANHSWLTTTWQAMRPYASGGAYQNYIDPDLVDWQRAYYSANLPRLQRVKATYDPGDLFHFAQSIPPPTAESLMGNVVK